MKKSFLQNWMNVYKVIILFYALLPFKLYSQKLIKFIDFYDETSVIMPDSMRFSTKVDSFDKLFTPTLEDARKCEEVFNRCLKSDTFLNFFPSHTNIRKWKRQYIGFYKKNSNTKYLLLNLLNFTDSVEANDWFRSWEKKFVSGSGEFYEINHRIILINIDSGECLKEW